MYKLLVNKETNLVTAIYTGAAVVPQSDEDLIVSIADVPIRPSVNEVLKYSSTLGIYTEKIEVIEDRYTKVSNIEVDYNGVMYQGDEESQNRMSRAINGLPDNTTTISWKAKDNSSQELTRVDLKEILFLAGQEQTRIWFS